MTIKISMPSGITIEADTVQEALAVVGALYREQKPVPDGRIGPLTEDVIRTRILTTNAHLDVLDRWGLFDKGTYEAMKYSEWEQVAGELGRSVEAARSLALRYTLGVYERNGSDPDARVIVHGEKDVTRPKQQM